MATPTEQRLSQLSHHVDAMEDLADAIDDGSPLALSNLLARLERLKSAIEVAAAK